MTPFGTVQSVCNVIRAALNPVNFGGRGSVPFPLLFVLGKTLRLNRKSIAVCPTLFLVSLDAAHTRALVHVHVE